MESELLTIDEAAHMLNIGRETVERWIERGLPVTREADGEQLVARADLDAFLAQEGQGHVRDAATEL